MESGTFWPRFFFVALSILLIATFVTSAGAERFFGTGLSGLPTLAGTSVGAEACGLVISSDAKVGYGHIGLNFNLPATDLPTLDLSFRDANVWIGSIGVRADSCSGFFLGLRGQGNVSPDIGIQTSEAAFAAARWDGSKLQWWTLDGNIGYKVRPCWSALVGLRRDQLSVGLTNPRDETGQPLNINIVSPGSGALSVQFHGDFSSRLWIPYLGLEIAGPQYRASLLWSPFAWADTKVPDVGFGSVSFLFIGFLEGDDLQYKVQKPIQFFEYNFEYNIDLGRNFACQVWSTGSWMQLRGRGNLDELDNTARTIFGFPVDNFTARFSSSNTATYTRSMISGGIGMLLSF